MNRLSLRKPDTIGTAASRPIHQGLKAGKNADMQCPKMHTRQDQKTKGLAERVKVKETRTTNIKKTNNVLGFAGSKKPLAHPAFTIYCDNDSSAVPCSSSDPSMGMAKSMHLSNISPVCTNDKENIDPKQPKAVCLPSVSSIGIDQEQKLRVSPEERLWTELSKPPLQPLDYSNLGTTVVGGTINQNTAIGLQEEVLEEIDVDVDDEEMTLDDESVYESVPSTLSSYVLPPDVLEKEERDEILFGCPEYCSDIYRYWRERDVRLELPFRPNGGIVPRGSCAKIEDDVWNAKACMFRVAARRQELLKPNPNYMSKQSKINANMRSVLMDWLSEVQEEFNLHAETFFLACRYVDRFLSTMNVEPHKLQLIGVTSIMIASKHEEIYPPPLDEFVYITDDAYTQEQVLKAERLILKTLDFQVSDPTVMTFLHYFQKIQRTDRQTLFFAQYLCELASLDVQFLNFASSALAAAALCLANLATFNVPWSVKIEEKSEYSVSDIYPIMSKLQETFIKAPSLSVQAIRDKYSSEKFLEVSGLSLPSNLPLL